MGLRRGRICSKLGRVKRGRTGVTVNLGSGRRVEEDQRGRVRVGGVSSVSSEGFMISQ